MAHLYFTEDALSGDARVATLTGDEARHAVQVARIRVGDEFVIADGTGGRANATVTDASPSLVRCEVRAVSFDPVPNPRMVLAQALAKGDRDELAIQSATELGVDVVVPWQAERSISRWSGEKASKGVARWRAIVREASKQSLRSRIPTVSDAVSTAHLLDSVAGTTWLVLDPRASESLASWAARGGHRDCIGLIVGPEGGIAPAELETLIAGGATPVRHGPFVLRTSTAGPAALSALGSLVRGW